MASRKVKHAAMMEKRAKWEAEVNERAQDFLKKDQARRAEERKKADEAAKERKIAKSKRLAKLHKQGVQEHKPAPVTKLPRPAKGAFSSKSREEEAS